MQLSSYQEGIIDWVKNGTGHGCCNAVAGSGKSPPTEPEGYEWLKKYEFSETSNYLEEIEDGLVDSEDDLWVEEYRGWNVFLYVPDSIAAVILVDPSNRYFLRHLDDDEFETGEALIQWVRHEVVDRVLTSPGQLELPFSISTLEAEPEGKDAILQKLGFIQQNDYDLESMGMGGDPVEEVYKDWEIGLHAPNAGIIGVSIHQINELDTWWWCPTEFTDPPFGYNDRDGVLAYARRAIDAVEQCPGQLALPLEVEKSEASQVLEVMESDELELCNLLEKLQALSKPRLRTVARELIDRLGREIIEELLH